jgi:lysophospholipase L1-like esterase
MTAVRFRPQPRVLWLVCALALLLVSPHGRSPQARPSQVVLAATPISRMDLPWWRQRHEAVLERIRRGRTGLVFLGDSITQDWERRGPPEWADFVPVWERFYGDRDAVNMGFVGDTTANLLWRVRNGEVDGISPKAVVVLIGANNLGRLHWSAADTVSGIEAIIAELRRRLPRTPILLLGVLPSDRSPWASATTVEINHALAERYGGAGEVSYLDAGPIFMNGGHLDRELFFDPKLNPPAAPLHPTAQAQERMAALMEPTLERLLGDRDHRKAVASPN